MPTRDPPPWPAHARHLVGSAWTRVGGDDGLAHYQVVEVRGAEAVLAAVLAPARRQQIPWRDLRDRGRWRPGWR